MNIFVGNIPFQSNEEELRELFAAFGEIKSVKIIMDRESGRSRGFGFVEMENKNDALEAMKSLDGKDFNGKALRVNESIPKANNNRNRNFNNKRRDY